MRCKIMQHLRSTDVAQPADQREGAYGDHVVIQTTGSSFARIVQDYRFAHRHNSASDAIRALIGAGLLAEGPVKPADDPEWQAGRLVWGVAAGSDIHYETKVIHGNSILRRTTC